MQRAYIIVVGNQGAGKSEWVKRYVSASTRLFVFDPTVTYDVNFDFSDELMLDVINGKNKQFRLGCSYPEDAELLGNAAFGVGKCTIVFEECGLLFKRGEIIDTWARQLIFMGRHPEVNVIFVAQRASSIPIDIRTQANRVVTFRQTNNDDVRAMRDFFGREHAESLSTLPDLACLDWELGSIRKYDLTPPTGYSKQSTTDENTTGSIEPSDDTQPIDEDE